MLRCVVLLWMAVLLTIGLQAEDSPSRAAPPAVNLTQEQQAVLRDYQGFEKRLADLGEALRGSDLDRANLLLQARSESQRQQVEQRLEEVVAILSDQRPYADAVERQRAVVAHMQAILKILQTDAERDRLEARIKELEAILKDTNRVIAAQKDVRADTERGGDTGKLTEDEQRVSDAARKLADKIDEQDARRAAESGAQPGEPDSNGKSPQDPMGDGATKPKPLPPNERQPDAGEAEPPKPGEPSPSQPSPSQPSPAGEPPQGPPMPGQSAPGQPQPGQPQPGQPPQQPQQPPQGQPPQPSRGDQPQDRTPGRAELEQAQREMEQAIQELRRKNRDGASNEQDEAIAQLEALKAQIEEILRQLREEEKELYLTMLEARFQEMLKLQLRINADTVRLDAKPAVERGEAHFTKSRDLSRQEQQNVLAADKALTLLKEEGSSVAFPEAVEQMRSNMDAVSVRLGKGDTGETSQLIEKLIVESLEEMVLSLQKELEKLKQDRQKPPGQPGQPQDPKLVDQLAELKMIRSLQNQVNRLTRQIGMQVEGETAQDADTLSLLLDLSRRQQRIQDATYDLSVGRNR